MSAFLIVELNVKDAAKLKEYSAQTPAILEEFGGVAVLKGKPEALYDSKGNAGDYSTMVVFQFPSAEKAREWYNSAQYQALLPLRDQAMESTFRILG